MEEIVIYTMKGCGHCDRIKELLHRAEVSYTEKTLDVDFTREEIMEMFPLLPGYPAMTVGGEYIGGVVESVKYFVEHGLVSSKK
jgi:glutaredoxin